MAIRLQRVLIACGLPTILAIVSFYWLRKRRKAVNNSSTEQTSKEMKKSTTNLVLEAENTYMSFNTLVKQFDINYSSDKLISKSNSNQIVANSCLELSSEEYAMQLRDNNNCSPSTDTDERLEKTTTCVCDDDGSGNSIAGSSDSGKGGSDILHATPIEIPSLDQNESVIYQFEIPQHLCGRLIGSGGRFVTQVKRLTNTSVVINKHVFSSDMKICTLRGTKPEIREALNQIRMRFPIADYPSVTLQQINLLNPTPTCPMPAQTCQLQLPSGISCDVILSSLVSAGHFFLQQPTHPTYPSLSRLDHHMIQTYSQQNTPLLPTIHTGMICAVPIMGGWYRAVITKAYDSEECDVMFVDYGGYSKLPVSSLRQIRYDFMSLPFQASECYLANVQPIDPEEGWTAEANALFEELAQGQILQAFIVGYSDNGIPYVNLFKIQGICNVFINQELVNQSHAQWIDNSA